MNPQRVRILKEGREQAGPVVYWMSRDQRVGDNWALSFAQTLALRREAPLVVVFALAPRFLEATIRQYRFMLSGLQEVERSLAELNIPLLLIPGSPPRVIPELVEQYQVGTLVTDFDPLRIKRAWTEAVLTRITCSCFEVDAHNLVPCWLASPKQEHAAYTLRPKLNRALASFIEDYPRMRAHPHSWREPQEPIAWRGIETSLQVDQTVPVVQWLEPGATAAHRVLQAFLTAKLAAYPAARNDPNRNGTSNLSSYLHFGQLAAQRVAREVQECEAPAESKAAFLEEVIVRRELAENYCYYNSGYDSFAGIPAWAQRTLQAHARDTREYLYTRAELEHAETHDPYWNAAQRELVVRGKMHGYLRMYWGKKLIEWSSTPAEAYMVALYLNDRYELDGRDPNGYTGVAWCFGTHDRPWGERQIFGKEPF
jgi:deoxyribodipyrimidine photo-lyase